jgi:signal transduction histidine kinase
VTLSTPGIRKARQRWNGQGELTCGPVRIRLFAYDLDGESLARIGPRMEVRAWLREWTGVSVYRDGFRVWPYGEPHDDWLRLDQRRVNNPVEHLSNNQMVGFIDITRDANPGLLDQTNREGFVHNQAVEDLRRLMYFVLQVLESERQTIRHPIAFPSVRLLALPPRKPTKASIADEVERLAMKAGPKLAPEVRKLGESLEEERVRESVSQASLLEGYEGLAAVGQMTSLLLPNLPGELEQVRADIVAIRKAATTLNGHGKVFERLAGAVESLVGRLEVLHLAAAVGNDRRRAIDLVAEVEVFRRAVEPVMRARDVRLEIEYPEREVIRTEMRPEHFHCLLYSFAANSLDWIDRGDSRRIRVTVGVDGDRCEVVFSDTGPGIPESLAQKIFAPGFSMKEGGRGMGLTLARRIAEGHGGQVEVIVDGRRKGANIRLLLPRKRSRATFNGR